MKMNRNDNEKTRLVPNKKYLDWESDGHSCYFLIFFLFNLMKNLYVVP